VDRLLRTVGDDTVLRHPHAEVGAGVHAHFLVRPDHDHARVQVHRRVVNVLRYRKAVIDHLAEGVGAGPDVARDANEGHGLVGHQACGGGGLAVPVVDDGVPDAHARPARCLIAVEVHLRLLPRGGRRGRAAVGREHSVRD